MRVPDLRSALPALFALLLSMWIVVPGPTPLLFALSVGTIELWPVVLLIALGAATLIARRPKGRTRAISLALAALAGAISLAPLAAYVLRGPFVPVPVLLGARGQTQNVAQQTSSTGDIVYAPVDAHALPIVIALYGGAWERGSPQSDRSLNETLASWGYVVVAADYPHAPQARWPAQREALLAELERVRTFAAAYGGDPHRIVLLGHSSGAQLALIAAALRPHEIVAVVTYESPVDLYLGYLHPSRPDVIHIQAILQALCGAPPEMARACYRSASPRYAVRAGMPPVLMFAAGRDHV
ncbi:MAG TPA: alpha/beta hydrolase, partial [Candidatus Baltobacteraceae bacterium]